jgi:hypothetical protein
MFIYGINVIQHIGIIYTNTTHDYNTKNIHINTNPLIITGTQYTWKLIVLPVNR